MTRVHLTFPINRMKGAFHGEARRINKTQDQIDNLDSDSVTKLVNRQLFFEANLHAPLNELTKSSKVKVSKRIVDFLTHAEDTERLFDQLEHGIDLLTDPSHDPVIEISENFAQNKEKMQREGGEVSAYRGLIEAELAKGVDRERPANKEVLSYLNTRKGNTPISEVLSEVVGILRQRTSMDHEEMNDLEEFMSLEEAGTNIIRMVEQWSQIDSAFDFDQ